MWMCQIRVTLALHQYGPEMYQSALLPLNFEVKLPGSAWVPVSRSTLRFQ